MEAASVMVGLLVFVLVWHMFVMQGVAAKIARSREQVADTLRESRDTNKRSVEELRTHRVAQQAKFDAMRKRREEMQLKQEEQMRRSEEMLQVQKEQLAVLQRMAAAMKTAQKRAKAEPGTPG